jgi:hypothetical protein
VFLVEPSSLHLFYRLSKSALKRPLNYLGARTNQSKTCVFAGTGEVCTGANGYKFNTLFGIRTPHMRSCNTCVTYCGRILSDLELRTTNRAVTFQKWYKKYCKDLFSVRNFALSRKHLLDKVQIFQHQNLSAEQRGFSIILFLISSHMSLSRLQTSTGCSIIFFMFQTKGKGILFNSSS